MHHYPFHPGDYTLETAHWSEDRTVVECERALLRDLAYRRLLDLYYGKEEPIPSKTQQVAIRIRMLKHEDVVALVLREKFTLVDGVWRQNRVEETIASYQRRAETSRENGRKGGRPRTNQEPKKNPSGSEQVATKNQKPRTKRNTPLPPEGEVAFGVFWNEYPRKVGRPKALLAYAAALARGATAEAILAGLKAHIPCEQWQDLTKVPHPTTWLNRDGWNDQVVSKGATASGGGLADWWESKTGLLDKGVQLGIPAPADESANNWAQFKANVWVAAGDGPWWDKTSIAYPIALRMREQGSALTATVLTSLKGEQVAS